jgi:hypothetical protein
MERQRHEQTQYTAVDHEGKTLVNKMITLRTNEGVTINTKQ